jgi:hypothetical protein
MAKNLHLSQKNIIPIRKDKQLERNLGNGSYITSAKSVSSSGGGGTVNLAGYATINYVDSGFVTVNENINFISGVTSGHTEDINYISGVTDTIIEDVQYISGVTDTNIANINYISGITDQKLFITDFQVYTGITAHLQFVDVTGDTMTGKLTVNDNIESSGQVKAIQFSGTTANIKTITGETIYNTSQINSNYIRSHNYDSNNGYKLEIDNLHLDNILLREGITGNTAQFDNVSGTTATLFEIVNRKIQSDNYTPGDLLGTGYKIEATPANSDLIADSGLFRKKFRATTFEMSKTMVSNGPHLFTVSATADSELMVDSGGTYFEINGSIPFFENDYIMSQIVDPGATDYIVNRLELQVLRIDDNKVYVADTQFNHYDFSTQGTSQRYNINFGKSGFWLVSLGDYVQLFSGIDLKAGDWKIGFYEDCYTSQAQLSTILMRVYDSGMTQIAQATCQIDANKNFFGEVSITADTTNCTVRVERGGGFERIIQFDPTLDSMWPNYEVYAEYLDITTGTTQVQDQVFGKIGNKYFPSSLIMIDPVGDGSPFIGIYDNCRRPYLQKENLIVLQGKISDYVLPDGRVTNGTGNILKNNYTLGEGYFNRGTIANFIFANSVIRGTGSDHIRLDSELNKISLIKNDLELFNISNNEIRDISEFEFETKSLVYELPDWTGSEEITLDVTTYRDWYREFQQPEGTFIFYNYVQEGQFYLQSSDNTDDNTDYQINDSIQSGYNFYVGIGNNLDYEFEIGVGHNGYELDPYPAEIFEKYIDKNVYAISYNIDLVSSSGILVNRQTVDGYNLSSLGGINSAVLSGYIDNSLYDNYYIRIGVRGYYWDRVYVDTPFLSVYLKTLNFRTNAPSASVQNIGISEIGSDGMQHVFDQNHYIVSKKEDDYVQLIKGGQQVDNLIVTGTTTIGGLALRDSTDRSGLFEINRLGTTGWAGPQVRFSATAFWSMMGNQTQFALYDDYNSKWILLHNESGEVQLYYNNSSKLQTTNTGINTQLLTATGATISNNINLNGLLLQDCADRSGLVSITRKGSTAWTGLRMDFNTSQWNIMGNDTQLILYDDDNNEYALRYTRNSAIELFHNGSVKFATTSGGIDVTGLITSDGITSVGTHDFHTPGNMIIRTNNSGQGSEFVSFYSLGGFTGVIEQGGTSLVFSSTSDRRLKKNIKNLDSKKSLDIINKLQPVNFQWKKDNSGEVYTGYVAQDCEALPDMVSYNEKEDTLMVSQATLIPYLHASIKELSKENNNLKKQLNDQNDIINNLIKRLEKLEKSQTR